MTLTRQAQVALAVCALPTGVAAQTTAIPLPQLTVEVSQAWCPADASEDAQRKMAGAAARMDTTVGRATLAAEGQQIVRIVGAVSVGRQTVPRDVPVIRRGSTELGRARWIERFRNGTFAVPIRVSSFDGRFESWEYGPLYGELAYYFFTSDFRDSHDFAFLSDDQREVGFCSRRREDTYIDGRVLFDDSGVVVAIDWFFATPSLDERAGGRVEFDPASARPLPEVGVYWRRLPRGDFQEWSDRYLSWSVQGAP